MLKKCHFIGIGGIGMSGLANLLLSKNTEVSGSDISSNLIIENLIQKGACVHIGHSAQHISSDMTVIYSTDIKKDNPEYIQAVKLKCPIIHRSNFLQKLMEGYQALTIAGTHGKTTTSALMTWVLRKCGLSPSYAIGGVVPQLNSNADHGKGSFFVAEACESDGTFLNYTPFGAIITNIDFDHMDYYFNQSNVIEAFREFINKVESKEHLFWCGDDPYLKNLNCLGISYGFSEGCALKGKNFRQSEWTTFFDVEFKGKTYLQVELSLAGIHNVLNALAVFGMAVTLGIEENAVRDALKTFSGVLRRCEVKGESNGILFLDDYAHHPTEIQTTLKAIRSAIRERRLVVVYQPHRYSRAKDCMGLYGKVFEDVDSLFITEIYAAREEPIPGVTHEEIISEIQKDFKDNCQFIQRKNAAVVLSKFLRPHDVLVTLGAGDVTKMANEVLDQFRLEIPVKLKVGVIFGGMSAEHDVTLLSVQNILNELSKEYYDIELFKITRQGDWLTDSDIKTLLSGNELKNSSKISSEIFNSLLNCDILFPVLHGTYGEDGTIQGMFEIFSKAYVGCDHRSAAICMDKVLTKQIVKDEGIAILPYVSFTYYNWRNNKFSLLNYIKKELHYPLFVKPVNLGSSIGISKVLHDSMLEKAIYEAFRFDTRVIIENGIENVREIEFSVLGNDEIKVFPPGEVFANGKVHDYDSKYGQNPNKAAAEFVAKADLSLEKINEGIELVKKAYQAVGCTGMARIDTFLDSKGDFWFNEINTIPGFTKYSLYPIICSANELPLPKLLDKLIILGLQRRREQERLEFTV